MHIQTENYLEEPAEYNGPLFAIEATTLPDGITAAGEFTYLGLVEFGLRGDWQMEKNTSN